MKYFQAVVHNNSFSEAAEECHLSGMPAHCIGRFFIYSDRDIICLAAQPFYGEFCCTEFFSGFPGHGWKFPVICPEMMARLFGVISFCMYVAPFCAVITISAIFCILFLSGMDRI